MIQYKENLYNALMKLCESNEAFYYHDFQLDGEVYRLFDYRLCSCSDFLHPGALECRGIMFSLYQNGNPKDLVAHPPAKFFNKDQCEFMQGIDYSKVKRIEVKADGSLISSYLHWNGTDFELRLKSKGSIESTQCLDAMEYLKLHENIDLHWCIRVLTLYGYTVNMEWCAPNNRIVLSYNKPQLTILNIRYNDTGGYVERSDPFLRSVPQMEQFKNHWIETVEVDDPVAFVEQIPEMEGIEGFVVHLKNGQMVKIKTKWYLVRHTAKDSINYPRRLFEAVLDEATDDMRSLFHDDPVAMKMIEAMELKVEHIYNHTIETVENFYETNKHLPRKDYAILGQKELDKGVFGLVMNKYTGKEFSYKEWMKKSWKKFGIKDEPLEEI